MAKRKKHPAPAPGKPAADEQVAEELVADVFDRDCPSRTVLAEVGGKWGALALLALVEGSLRFNALRRRVDGVSEKMLSQSLQALERDGLVARDVRSAIPPCVEYSLTTLGRRIAAPLQTLVEVLEAAMPAINDARAAHPGRPRDVPQVDQARG